MIDWTEKKIGNYQILRPIGHGGFADIYLGQHTYLQTYAAIKILQARLAQIDLAVFLNEARTIANLTHPHIMRVLEFGEEGQTPYLVMDYCPNGSLRQRHPRGTRLSLQECVGYIKQIASALQYAHDRKIIHRDVKPENILIGRDNFVLLADFGIAIISQSSRYSNRQDMSGTIAYAAPEQLQGKATFASDQYALGIIAYEWLTGDLPFKGSFPEIASQHVVAPVPSLRDKVPGLPQAVEQVLQKALAKDPQQRFGSIQEFANALEQATNVTFTGSTILSGPPNQEHISTYVSPLYAPTVKAPPSPFLPNTTGSNVSRTTPAYMALSSNPSFVQMQDRPVQKSKTGMIITGLVILILLLGGVSVWALTRSPSSTNSSTNTANSVSSNTQASQKTSPVAIPTPVSTAPVGSETINKNLKLTCTCDDPIALTVSSIIIDSNKGNMTWNLSFKNVGGQNYHLAMNDFHLESTINGQQQTYNASGALMQSTSNPLGVLTNGIDPGQTIQTPVIFSFVPLKNTQYTVNAWILNDGGETFVSIKFDPATLTFS